MTSFNPGAYNISVAHECIDGEWLWVAKISELPDVTEYASDREFAIELAVDTLVTLNEICLEQGVEMPPPNKKSDC